jgi:hypothetical protein
VKSTIGSSTTADGLACSSARCKALIDGVRLWEDSSGAVASFEKFLAQSSSNYASLGSKYSPLVKMTPTELTKALNLSTCQLQLVLTDSECQL